MRGYLLIATLLVTSASLAMAQALPTMPSALANRWVCATEAGPGWNAAGYNDRGWVPVSHDVSLGYPDWMESEQQVLFRFMWHPGGSHRGSPVYFRRSIWLPGQIDQATIKVCADDIFGLYINGLGVGYRRKAGETGDFEVAGYLKTGQNVIALSAMDIKPPGYGLLVAPEITQSWPFEEKDRAWRCSPAAAAGWTQKDFDDSHWQAAAKDSAPPIALENLGSFSCFSLPKGIPEYSSAYFRRVLEIDGLPVAAQVTILADDGYELYVNGAYLAVEKRVDKAYWPATVDVTPHLQPGKNVIAVKVSNTWGPGRLYCVPTVKMVF